MSAPIRSRLLTGTPVEEHSLLMPVPWIGLPADATDTAFLTAVGITVGVPAVVASGQTSASATLTSVPVTVGIPAVSAEGVNETASWGMIPIGVA